MRHSLSSVLWLALFGSIALAACGDDDDSGAPTDEDKNGDGIKDDDPFANPSNKPMDFPSKPPMQVIAGASGGDGGLTCDNALKLTLRDFTEDHPDFESYTGDGLDGIVEEDLGSDHKPVYAHDGGTEYTTGPDEFAQWYHDVDGVNQRVEVAIDFTETSPGTFSYDNGAFFPLDGMGFGNGPGGASHNYLFTTEAHTLFTYKGGEVFTFRGDDDLWVFVNNKLAVDLGGLHSQQEESVDFDRDADELGIEIGQTYPMDIFHAERHTSESNFRIETTIDLSCIENVDVDVN